jgi:aspartate/methionine/tyrosine aminotransferase
LEAAGTPVVDLADANPTRHGLTLPAVAEVWAEAARRSQRYDPDPRGPVAAREALAAHFGGGPDDYWLTASTSEAYAWLGALLADPGDALAIPAPGYPLIEPLARYGALTTRAYPLHYLHPYGWSLDPGGLVAATAAPAVRAVVAVNPGNPTGAYTSAAERAALVETCRRGGLSLVADEVFWPFAIDWALPEPSAPEPGGAAAAPPPASPARPERLAGEPGVLTFALDGLSKRLCAPQAKVAWIRLSGPAAAVAAARPLLDQIADAFLPVNGAAGLALPGWLALADAAAAAVQERLRANLACLRARLDGDWARVRRCDGGWTALVDLPQTVPDPALSLLADQQVAVHPGWFYDLPDPGCVALSLLPAPEVFAAGCDKLAAWAAAAADRPRLSGPGAVWVG